jgi:hypothetical protein
MSDAEQTYVHALALGLDPAWRRRPDEERHDDGCRFADAVRAHRDGVRGFTYSSIGLEAGVDLLLCLVNPYKVPHETVMRTIEIMGKHVIPRIPLTRRTVVR